MATIVPKTLIIRNFLSYEDQRFDFKVGVFGIVGENQDIKKFLRSNGSGKTGFAEGILYCITGRTFKGLKANGIIREGQKKAYLKFIFKVNGKLGYIIHKRNPNKIIFFNGHEFVEASTLPELQKKIMDFFGVDFDILTRFIIVGEKDRHKFSFLGSDDRSKKDLLTKLTNSSIIDRAYEKVTEKIVELEGSLQVVTTKLESKQTVYTELKEDLKETQAKILETVNDVDISKIKKFERANSLIEKKIEELKEDKDSLRADSLDIEKNCDDRVEKLELSKIKIDYKLLKIAEIKSITCPHCKKDFEINSHTYSAVTDAKEIKAEKAILEKRKKGYEEEISQIQEQSDKKQKALIRKMEALEDSIDDGERLINSNNGEVKALKSKIKTKKDIYLTQVREIKEKMSKIEKSLKILDIEFRDVFEKNEMAKKFKYHFGKEGLKNYLFSKKMRLIEQTVNDVLRETSSTMSVRLSGMTRLKSGKWNQKISGKIKVNDKERNFDNLSKGESRIIDLSFILAFSKLLSFKNNILLRIFDEPFSGLDDVGKKEVIDMLKSIRKNSIYIISPETELIERNFEEENIYTVIKKNNISRII